MYTMILLLTVGISQNPTSVAIQGYSTLQACQEAGKEIKVQYAQSRTQVLSAKCLLVN